MLLKTNEEMFEIYSGNFLNHSHLIITGCRQPRNSYNSILFHSSSTSLKHIALQSSPPRFQPPHKTTATIIPITPWTIPQAPILAAPISPEEACANVVVGVADEELTGLLLLGDNELAVVVVLGAE